MAEQGSKNPCIRSSYHWLPVPISLVKCAFYFLVVYFLSSTHFSLPWPSWQNRTCAWRTIPVTMWVTYKRIQKRNKYAWWTTKHKTKQTRIQKLKQKHNICEINNPNNNMGSRAWDCGYVVIAFDLFSCFFCLFVTFFVFSHLSACTW